MSFAVALVSWHEAEAALRAVRETVFMQEQGVPAELEWDGLDATACHALARDETGRAIGCGRLLPDGHLGRIAVLSDWRGRGVGTALMRVLLAEAERRGMRRLELAAQLHALPFYRRFGFLEQGGIFMDAGMPHRTMVYLPLM